MALGQVIDALLHHGIATYKKKNSGATLPQQAAATKAEKRFKQGAIFAVRSKQHFTAAGVKGYIITSKETLLEDAHTLTHFTPNVYRQYTYTDASRRYICGFDERSLLQINTFVVDIDTKKYSPQHITLACMDHSIGLPTLIVESDNGYQLYFALETPYFISNKDDFKCLKIAKRIAQNLKSSLQIVEADMLCNDFGFFRMPTEKNIVFQQLHMTYTLHELIQWSMRYDDDNERTLFVVPSQRKQTALTESAWFQKLLQSVDVKGERGKLGRNNTLFTAALSCYADQWDIDQTAQLLYTFNSKLHHPLPQRELHTILTSAYSGKYNGPSKQYIEALLGEHTDVTIQTQWYKFKKDRDERVKSHYTEWEDDLVTYISSHVTVENPFIWHTQKELCEQLNMPQSSLNDLLKQSKRLIKIVIGKGRGAKTGWSTIDIMRQHLYIQKRQHEQAYHEYIEALMNYLVPNEAAAIISATFITPALQNTS